MARSYTLADYVKIANRHKREREDKIIEKAQERNYMLDTKGYFMASAKSKKKMRAEAYTIPLEAYGFKALGKDD